MAMKSPKRSKSEKMPHPKSPTNRSIDVEAELGIHPVRRPTDIEHDVNDLGQKKKVSSVLTSPMFKEELETVVTDLLRSGDGGGHVIAREIANILSPLNRSQYSLGDSTWGLKTGVGCVSPINDITGSDTALYSKGEKLMRCKLAALYRLVDLNGWSQSIYNHISLRVSKEQEHFLINPFGLLYHEVSASKLLKITMQGEVVDQGPTTFCLNKAGFTLHSAVHSARPDAKCVIHVHTPDVVAVSMMECGLLLISQEAMIVGEVSYHPYQGILVDQKEKKLIQKHLGPNNKVMFLRNHGLIVCGETVEEAYHYLYHVMLACQTQVRAMSCSKHEKLIHVDKSLKAKTHDVVNAKEDQMMVGDDDIKWEVGEMMFEANMRMLDNMGYRTGYAYRNITPIRKSRVKSDHEIPGSSPGHVINLDDIQDSRSRLHSHPPQSRWVNSPNQYTKVSGEGSSPGGGPGSMNGDMSPKSKTKWRNEESSNHGTPIRIADANQFVPKNTDPREVAEKRKKIRSQGRWDENHPGPQSQKLDGGGQLERRGPPSCFSDSFCSTAYDDLKHRKRAEGDGITTGSKGIIQRDISDVRVVTGPPNPFAQSEAELEAYKKEVEKKTKKDSETEEVPEVFEQERAAAAEQQEVDQGQHQVDDVIDGVAIQVTKEEPKVEVRVEPVAPPPEPQVQKPDEAPPIVVTQPSPPPPQPKEEHRVQKEPKVEEKIVKSRPKESAPPPPAEQKKKPVEVTDENKNKAETPKKQEETNAKPKTEKKSDTPKSGTPDAKDDPKGKQKKNKKRRSLSFLKKNKEKKEKE